MRAHQIMTKPVITVSPETTIVEAANIMLQNISAAFRWWIPAARSLVSSRRVISFAAAKSVRSASVAAGFVSFWALADRPPISFRSMGAELPK